MGIEDNIQSLNQWLLPIPGQQLGGLLTFLIALVILIVCGIVFGFAVSVFRNGPFEAFYAVFGTAVKAVPELLSISPRRVWAMTWLAIQEAIRKKVLIIFAIFLLVLLVAGWYINPSAEQPVRLYLTFVLTFPKWLVLLLVIGLSVFSLPDDIKNRTIYTIFTKPVLPSEIFLGRLFGFVAVGTGVLVVMAVLSYVFLLQGLRHTHYINANDLVPGENGTLIGETTESEGHKHTVTIYPEGDGETDLVHEHRHTIVTKEGAGPEEKYVVQGPSDMFQARVRHIGTVQFLDRSGKNPSDRGINVGKEWEYFSYIEGGTFGAAVFTFDDVNESLLNSEGQLPVEFNLSVFRTYKGTITEGIRGNYYFKNPETGARSIAIPFTAKEESDLQYIPRKLSNFKTDPKQPTLDLIEDLTTEDNGRLELWIQCVEPGQYFGVAQNSVYILEDNRSFLMNYIKCYVGIWFQVVLVITFGLVFSTFLKGPVALLGSFLALGYGTIAEDVRGLARNVIFGEKTGWYGGGPTEAMVRLFQQKNIMTELGDYTWVKVIQSIDMAFAFMIYAFVNMLPDYSMFDTMGFVVDGYNIPLAVVAEQLITVIGFLVALVAVGYFFLKSKEIAA
ncbi:ABC transporter permease [Bremerella cremea]|uniref:ABC transporter permease n=1 Tax=Bremerella cremea TaxID=1031537 RepID=A0A368KNM5_9BACT|nr:ABC transporter permease [Bremerella cremea]RCS46054.1 ABC transporter permease [Bremerella cremea]